MLYVSNAFSLGMLPRGLVKQPLVAEIYPAPTKGETLAKTFARIVRGFGPSAVSFFGHETTANILGVEFNRSTLKLSEGDVLIVAQYDGPRLPEGAKELPEGASFRYFQVRVM